MDLVIQKGPQVLSEDSKSFTLACPDGKRAVGGGAAVTGIPDKPDRVNYQTKNVAITGVQPSGENERFLRVSASEIEGGITADWQLVGYAICINPFGSGWEAKQQPSYWDSDPWKPVTVVCPVGKEVIGFGFGATSGQGGGYLVQHVEPGNYHDVHVVVHEDWNRTSQNWSASSWRVWGRSRPSVLEPRRRCPEGDAPPAEGPYV